MAAAILKLVLRINGVVMLTALAAVVMPFDWMQHIHRSLGMGELPDQPIVGYLARSLSLLYAAHGALLIFTARDLDRYLPLIRFLAVLDILFGGIMLCLDIAVGMPARWTSGEGPFIILLGAVLFRLARKSARAKTP